MVSYLIFKFFGNEEHYIIVKERNFCVVWPNLGMGMLHCRIRATGSILSLHGAITLHAEVELQKLNFKGCLQRVCQNYSH
jgi:hypothetical protein